MMQPLLVLFASLALNAAPVLAEGDEPTAEERKTIADCLDKSSSSMN
jgi:hypothetical protein